MTEQNWLMKWLKTQPEIIFVTLQVVSPSMRKRKLVWIQKRKWNKIRERVREKEREQKRERERKRESKRERDGGKEKLE